MNIKAIKTHRIEGKESICDLLDRYIGALEERTILAITSKIVSVCEGRVVPRSEIHKEDLVRQEADVVVSGEDYPYDFQLTIKNNMFIPSAGIDESNGDGVYILYPKDAMGTAQIIWRHLKDKHNIRDLGIIITDSHTTPLRRGVTGIAIAWCGFAPLYSYIGRPDIYNHPLRVTQTNLVDALAASAVFVMGEGSEQTPLALIKDAPRVNFVSTSPFMSEIAISPQEDIYAPLLQRSVFP